MSFQGVSHEFRRVLKRFSRGFKEPFSHFSGVSRVNSKEEKFSFLRELPLQVGLRIWSKTPLLLLTQNHS